MSDRRSPVQLEPEFDALDLDLDLEPDDLHPSIPLKKVPAGDLYEAARAGDVDRLKILIEGGANVNLRDRWDSVALYYACLAGHFEAAQMLLEAGAVCSEKTFDGDRWLSIDYFKNYYKFVVWITLFIVFIYICLG